MRPGISYDLIKNLVCRMCGSFIVCILLEHFEDLKYSKRSLSKIFIDEILKRKYNKFLCILQLIDINTLKSLIQNKNLI